jgi:hypothetical protein
MSYYKSHPLGQKRRTLSTFTIFLEMFGNGPKIGFQTIILKQLRYKTRKTPDQAASKVKLDISQANLVSHIKSYTRYRTSKDKRHYINGSRIAF